MKDIHEFNQLTANKTRKVNLRVNTKFWDLYLRACALENVDPTIDIETNAFKKIKKHKLI